MKGRVVAALANTLHRPAATSLHGSSALAGFLSITALTNVAILLVNLASGIIQARALGPEGRGELTTAMIWPGLVTGIGALGLYGSVSYYTAKERDRPSTVLASAFAIAIPQTLALTLVAWAILPIVLHGKPSQVLSDTRFFLWIIPLVPLASIPQSYLQGRLAIGWYNALLFCNAALSTAIVAALWTLHRLTVRAALAANLASWGVTAGICFVSLLIRRDWSWRPNLGTVRPLLWFGVRAQVGNIAAIVLQQRLDLILLSVFISTGALGTYAVAGSAATVAATLPSAACIVLYPIFARQTPATLPLAMSRFLLASGLLMVVTGPVLLILIPLAVPYVFGPAFSGARPLAALLTLAYLIRGWGSMLGTVIVGSGRPFAASVGATVEFGSLAALLAILIPRFGMTGAAAAMIISAAVSSVSLQVVALSITKLTPSRLARMWSAQIRAWRGRSVGDHAVRSGPLDP